MIRNHQTAGDPSQDRPDPPVPVALPIAHPPRHNLPAHASTFVGRGREIAEGTELLSDHRLVTIVGAGGIGKTRLALEIAAAAVSWYPDGAWLVELAGVQDEALVAETILAVLPDLDRAARGAPDLVNHLADRQLLLVLDNCEHLLAGCSILVDQILRACARITVLATSREALGPPGERLLRLAPLGLPGREDLDVATVGASEAVSLFVERGRSVCPGFALTTDMLPDVVDICRRVDGLPLAIELAAARLAILTPADIVAHLDDRFRFLVQRGAATPRRHQTMAAAIAWSYDLLPPNEATLFGRLGVFAGGWRLHAASEVCAGGTVDVADVVDLLEALAAKSLVVVDRGRRDIRYRMLETVRHFALERLAATGDGPVLAERHARWCVAVAEHAEAQRRGRNHDSWLRALEEDHDNFRAALTWARENDRVDMVLALGGALSWFWETRGHLREGLEWLRWAVAHDPGADYEARARALRGAGVLSWLLGEVDAAMPLVDESVSLFRQAGNDEEAEGCVCTNAFHLCANPSHALPVLESSVARMRGEKNLDRLAHALVNCGMAHFFVGDSARARECFDECLGLRLGAVEAEVMAGALLGLGRVAFLAADFTEADAAFREALDIVQLTGDDDGRSTALSWIAEMCRLRGDHGLARSLLAGAVQLVEHDGPALSVARCRQFLARLEVTTGDHEAARGLFADSLSQPGVTDMPYHHVRSLLGLAECAAAAGARQEARTLLERAMASAKTNGDRQALAHGLCLRARLASEEGQVRRASRFAHQSLEVAEEIGDVVGIVAAVEELAVQAAAAAGRGSMAARLYGAADRARDRLHLARSVGSDAARAACLERLEDELGADEVMRFLREGARLDLREAVSYAAKGWDRRARPAYGLGSLTRAERDVVALVVDGLTNPEIGARLFTTPRTVSTHLAHIYRKMGMTSRRELVHALRHNLDQGSGPNATEVRALRQQLTDEERPADARPRTDSATGT